MKAIDVIIPAYNAHDTLGRCLASIACQTAAQDARVTVVDDGSDRDYQSAVAPFQGLMDIQLLRLESNVGPGMARQYGYDHTQAPLVTYVDADDTLAGAFSLALLRRGMAGACACVGAFCEEQGAFQFALHQQDMVWMFGKMYSRAFLDQYQVRFTDEPGPSRANEDNGYNTIARLLATPQQPIHFIADNVYFWHRREDSITRKGNCQYSYDQSFVGYAANMEYAIAHAGRFRPFSEAVSGWALQCMCHLYAYYFEALARAPQYAQQNWAACQRYYDRVYRGMADRVTGQALAEAFSQVMAASAGRLSGVAPQMTIWQFLDALKGGQA